MGDRLSVKMFANPNAAVTVPIGDGTSRPLSGYFVTLAAAQAVYSCAVALTDELAWCAIQTATNFCSTQGGGRLHLPLGDYPTNRTWELISNLTVYGIAGKTGAIGVASGTYLRWTGPVDTPILRAYNTRNLVMDGLHVYGAQTSGVIGLLIDSNNSPSSSGNAFKNLVVDYCGAPAYPGGFPVDGCGIQIGASLSGNQMDSTWLLNCQVSFSRRGYWFRAGNSGQGAYIKGGNVAFCVKGFDLERTGGLLTIENVTGSICLSTLEECAWIYVRGTHGPIDINACQVEAGFGFGLLVESGLINQGSGNAITLRNCVLNHKSEIRSDCTIYLDGGYSTSDFILTASNVDIVSKGFDFTDPAVFGASPFSTGHLAVTNGSADVKLVIGGYLTTGCTSSATLLEVAASPYDYVVGQIYGLDNEVVRVTALTDATHVTVTRAEIATAAAAHSPQIMNLFDNVHTPGWDDWQDRSTITIGGVNYTLTVTGFMSGTLAPVYAGATNAAIAYSLIAPVREIVEATGSNTKVLRLGPTPFSMQDLDCSVAGLPATRFRGVRGGATDAYVEYWNATQKWQTHWKSNGQMSLVDATAGTTPWTVFPGAATNSLIFTSGGPQIAPAPVVTSSDLAPNGRTDSCYYFAFVSSMPLMNGSNLLGYPAASGSIFGFTLSLSSYGYTYQQFHDGGTNKIWLRTATSATVWGPWIDMTAGVTNAAALTNNQLVGGAGGASGVQSVDLTGAVTTSGTLATTISATGLAAINAGLGAASGFATLVAAVKAALALGIGDISGLTAALAAKADTGTVTSGPSAGAAHTHTI
jgi:hypothetical protein